MTLKVCVCIITAYITACLMAVSLAYRTQEFFTAEMAYVLAPFLIASVLMVCFKVKGMLRYQVAYFALGCILAMSHSSIIKLMSQACAAGFKRAAFSAGSQSEWESLVPLAEKWFSSNSGNDFDRNLPSFTQRVYPGNPPYAVVSGDPTPEGLHVGIWWRNATVCIGFDIGKGKPQPFVGELFRKPCTNDMSIVVFRGG